MTDVSKIVDCIESSPYPSWLATSRGECLYINPELERLIGFSSDQMRQADWCGFVLEEDRAAASASWQGSLGSGTPYRKTVRLRRFDGVPASVELITFGHTLDEGVKVWLFTGLYAHETAHHSSELETQLQATLNVIPAYTWYALPSGALTFVNERTGNYLGLPKDHPLRFGIDTGAEWDAHIPLLHPDDRDESRRVWSACVRTGSPSENSFRVRSAEGEYRWFLSRVEALRATDGSLLYWIGVNLDIDERKHAEERLQERERELSAIIQTVPSMLWSMSPTGETTHISERCLEYSGASLERILSQGWLRFIHPDDQDVTAKAFSHAIETGESYSVVYRLRRADGDYRWHHARAEPMRDSHGTIVQWYGLLNDIDEQKRAEEKIRSSERELRALVETIPAFVGTALPDGSCDFLSDSWLDYLGFTKEQGLGWGWADSIHPEDIERVVTNWREGLAAGKPVEQELRCRNASGTYHWFLNRDRPLYDSAGNVLKWYGTLTNIDSMKETEQALQMREHELLNIIETVPSMLWSTSPTGEPGHNSQRLLEYIGAPPEEYVNRAWLNFIHTEDREETASAFFRAMETGESYNVIHRLRRADGEYRWHQTMGEPLRDPQNHIAQWYGLSIDIDERKRAEQALLKSEGELRTLIDAIPAFVGTALSDGSVDFISQSWMNYTGLSKEQGLGGGWTSVIHPEDLDRVLASWQAGLATGMKVEHELRCRRSDGLYEWFLYRSIPLRDDRGNAVKWYGTLTNVNALKETESALQAREHELLSIIETIPSMIWSLWPTGEPNHLSPSFLEYFGVPFGEIASRGWERFVHPDDREESSKAFFRAMKTGEPYNIINRLRRADGDYRWHQSRGEPLRDPRGKIIRWYGLAIDIDERKRAEDHLRDTRLKLAKASGLATVAELAGSIAHELNQPLMSILANAQAAKSWLNAAQPNIAEVNSAIERTIRDARGADETMQHIRALFKRASFDKKDVNIPDILREVVRVVQEDPKKRNVPIECSFEESLPMVHVDQIQIQQVFINLITNAIEVLEDQPARLVVLQAAADSNEILIQVVDNGPGVDDPERIFDAFMTTKEKGMGIGLAVSRSIVEAHGGRLWAKNRRTDGAIFNVALPLSHPSSATT